MAAIGLLASLVCSRQRWLWLVMTCTGTLATIAAAALAFARGTPWTWQGGFRIGGEMVALQCDAVAALFLALHGLVGAAGAVYAMEYWRDTAHPRTAPLGRVFWSLLLLSILSVLVAANGLHFLISWELFTLSAYCLITLERRRPDVRAAGWLYLGASHTATLALFAFFAALAANTGSWQLGPMHDRTELAPLLWLALFGFGMKAGVFPLHIWLPSAHANAPSHVSAMMSGVTIKLGIYGLVRFSGWLPTPPALGLVIVCLGLLSAILGVAFALGQHDLKRLLAYHSVENIGIILIGLGFALVAVEHRANAWGRLALAGGLLHVWNHGIFKALLFFGAGSVLHTTGTREMSRLGGLWRTMPWTASLFGLGAMAIAGLPPWNGFVSEWLVYLGLFEAAIAHRETAWAALPAAIALGVTGALALACFVKVCGVVFLGAPRTAAAAHAHETGFAMRLPMVVLALFCVAIGLAPTLFWPAIARAVGDWHPDWRDAALPPGLAVLGRCHVILALVAATAAFGLLRQARRNGIRRALTWDCGYAAPTPRMQYTAGGMAALITQGFAWILRPVLHRQLPSGMFPGPSVCEEHTPETVLERVVEPLGRGVMRAAAFARRLQHGRLQAYVLYLLVGLLGLALVVWTTGAAP